MRRQKSFSKFLILIGLGITLGSSITIFLLVINPFAENELPIQLAFGVSPTALPSATPPDTFAHIMIAAAEVNQIIVPSRRTAESWEIDHLGMNVGHLEGTAWINEPGNMVLAGHIDLPDGSPGIFSKFDRIQIGDIVVLIEKGVEYHYRVTEIKEVEPTDISVVFPTESPRLTLITCSDYDLVSNTYKTRLIVVAEKT